jgi:hypothetical protein
MTLAQDIRNNARLADGTETSWLGCQYCRHLRTSDGISWCAAFPQGIPLPIQMGQVDHLEPRFDQDNEVVFEPVPKLEDWIRDGMPEELRAG